MIRETTSESLDELQFDDMGVFNVRDMTEPRDSIGTLCSCSLMYESDFEGGLMKASK